MRPTFTELMKHGLMRRAIAKRICIFWHRNRQWIAIRKDRRTWRVYPGGAQ